MKTMVIKTPKPRNLRSAKEPIKDGKNSKKKGSPRTRSQKKQKSVVKKESKSKRKIISKLVESIK